MREPNLGITTSCAICGRRFWCEDGIPICSSACSNVEEEMHCPECNEEKEVDDKYCQSCGQCEVCGEEKEPSQEFCGGDYCKEDV